jgi:lipopolysaccharide/colanic/teichoic acid biosynthesis glycosyltransferase
MLLQSPTAPAAERRRTRRSFEDDRRPLEGAVAVACAPLPRTLAVSKRCVDVALSLALLVVLLPVFAVVALVIACLDGRPVLYAQARTGLGGVPFTLYKFRTMHVDADLRRARLASRNEQSGPVFKMRHDPRVTRVGRWLRKFSVDELPQLWNVLRGDMSLVGPRPPLPSEVAEYRQWQLRRLSVRPGLTCTWQVSGRSNVAFDEWVRMDIRYIESLSLRLDTRLLAKTIPAVLRGHGAW